jgi:thioesterase domain-containing protein/acyl carrier protein
MFDHDLKDYRDYHDEKSKSFCGGSRGAVFSKSVPLAAGGKLYRTGDLARWLQDGNIEFLGRIDHQVKIRGYRIELGEIESQLKKHDEIKEAIVIDRENETGEKYLFAYIIPVPRSSQSSSSTTSLKTPALKDFLSHSLPDYMIPTYFIEIDKIPLTRNGKIDRKALPAPEIGAAAGNYLPPRDKVEKKLADIWAEILGIEKDIIGIDADFFELGGHSIKAAMAASRIQKEFNIVIPLVELFRTPFIKSLAERIRVGVSGAGLRSPKDDTPVLLKPATARTGSAPGTNNLFLIHDGTGEVEGYIEFCKHLSDDMNYWGLRADRLENLAPRNQTIEEMARNYIEKIKRIQPGSPYYIVGWSFGGTVAFEIVKQLEQQKENTGFLGLVDSPPPHKDAGNKAGEFNLESELNFVRDYSIGSEMKEKLENVNEFSQLWLLAADYLEADHYDVEIIKKAITHYGVQALPGYRRLNIRESIYYLNVGRTFRHAWMDYTPGGSIHTPVYYFAAAESREINKEGWSDYCSQPIRFYEISGDHFSIFRMPEVEAFAKLFAKILPGSSIVDI